MTEGIPEQSLINALNAIGAPIGFINTLPSCVVNNQRYYTADTNAVTAFFNRSGVKDVAKRMLFWTSLRGKVVNVPCSMSQPNLSANLPSSNTLQSILKSGMIVIMDGQTFINMNTGH